jgi:hypothetical protein
MSSKQPVAGSKPNNPGYHHSAALDRSSLWVPAVSIPGLSGSGSWPAAESRKLGICLRRSPSRSFVMNWACSRWSLSRGQTLSFLHETLPSRLTNTD